MEVFCFFLFEEQSQGGFSQGVKAGCCSSWLLGLIVGMVKYLSLCRISENCGHVQTTGIKFYHNPHLNLVQVVTILVKLGLNDIFIN